MAEHIFMSPQMNGSSPLGFNIMDIIDAISDDKDFAETDMPEYSAAGRASSGTPSVASTILSRTDPEIEQKKKAYVQIIEQPQPKALRFRYICEGRSAGSIPGVRSTSENKTYPTIKIMNYKGPAVVVVSCVTVDPPYRPHPHNLVGKEGCSKGVCTVTLDTDSMEYSFSNLGIQCVKRKDVEQALKLREEIRVDPFGTGFNHRNQTQNLDLNSVRLCFQVFLNNGKGSRFTFPLKPVVSEPIYDKKATSDLNICKLSDCTSCVSGGKEIILLCDKVTKEDIQVRFFEVKDGHVEWEGYGDFQASDVHKQVAICFKTPKYKDLQIDHSVKVYVQLVRPSDNSTSEPRPFDYLPMDADRFYTVNKRRKIYDESTETSPNYIGRIFKEARSPQDERHSPVSGSSRVMCVAPRMNAARLSDDVKVEPPDSYGIPNSAEVGGMPGSLRTLTVKAPISSQHSGGGLMYQTIPALPLSHQTAPSRISPLYYVSTSPTDAHMEMPPPIQQDQHFYQMSSQPPQYSPDHQSSAVDGPSYNPSPMDIIPGTPASNFEILGQPALPAFHMFEAPKPPHMDVNNEILPDLGVINSSELYADSVNNLSASLSCSLNLTDVPFPMNHLDKKNLEEDKRSLCTPISDSFLPNIPNDSCNSVIKSEDIPSSSDSVKVLKKELETLNKLSQRR